MNPNKNKPQALIDHWKSGSARWQSIARKDGDGWNIDLICVESSRFSTGYVYRSRYFGDWPRVVETIKLVLCALEQGIYVQPDARQ